MPSLVFPGLPLALLYTSLQETPALAQGESCLCNNVPGADWGETEENQLMVKGSLLISKITEQHFSSKNKASIIVSPLQADLLTTFLLLSPNFLILF